MQVVHSLPNFFSLQIFNGNNDSNTVATNEFIPVVATTRFVVKPLTWSVGGMGLRFELYGCYEGNNKAFITYMYTNYLY
jgi:hypothetical protein